MIIALPHIFLQPCPIWHHIYGIRFFLRFSLSVSMFKSSHRSRIVYCFLFSLQPHCPWSHSPLPDQSFPAQKQPPSLQCLILPKSLCLYCWIAYFLESLFEKLMMFALACKESPHEFNESSIQAPFQASGGVPGRLALVCVGLRQKEDTEVSASSPEPHLQDGASFFQCQYSGLPVLVLGKEEVFPKRAAEFWLPTQHTVPFKACKCQWAPWSLSERCCCLSHKFKRLKAFLGWKENSSRSSSILRLSSQLPHFLFSWIGVCAVTQVSAGPKTNCIPVFFSLFMGLNCATRMNHLNFKTFLLTIPAVQEFVIWGHEQEVPFPK